MKTTYRTFAQTLKNAGALISHWEPHDDCPGGYFRVSNNEKHAAVFFNNDDRFYEAMKIDKDGCIGMSDEYRIEFSVQRRGGDDDDFAEIGFGSSGTCGDVDATAYAVESIVQNRQWETNPACRRNREAAPK